MLGLTQASSMDWRTPSLQGTGLAPTASSPALTELSPLLDVLTGRRRKPPSSQRETAAAAGPASCNRNREYYFCNDRARIWTWDHRDRAFYSLVPAQKPAGQVSPISTPCPWPQVSPPPEFLLPKLSSRSHSLPASPHLFHKGQFMCLKTHGAQASARSPSSAPELSISAVSRLEELAGK